MEITCSSILPRLRGLFANTCHEMSVAWHFMKSNVDATWIPFNIFTMAALLQRNAPWHETISALIQVSIYCILYIYTFDIPNQTARPGSLVEDKINKPHRPIVAGMTTVTAAKKRFYILLAAYFAYSYALDVQKWTVVWLVTLYGHCYLGLSDFGPTKDLCMSTGTISQSISQLMAAWQIGGSNMDVGWHWVKLIALWVIPTVAFQDYRDVPGDLIVGRRTTPILIGDLPARIYNFTGLLGLQYLYVTQRVLDSRFDGSTIAISACLAAVSLVVVGRTFAFRSVSSDAITYRCYTALYANLVAAGVSLRQ